VDEEGSSLEPPSLEYSDNSSISLYLTEVSDYLNAYLESEYPKKEGFSLVRKYKNLDELDKAPEDPRNLS